MKILRLDASGEYGIADIANTLEAFQKLVGGYIEVLEISAAHRMIVNEEGKLKKLPYNKYATQLLREWCLTPDFIVGNVFIVKADGEDFTDISDNTAELIFLETGLVPKDYI